MEKGADVTICFGSRLMTWYYDLTQVLSDDCIPVFFVGHGGEVGECALDWLTRNVGREI